MNSLHIHTERLTLIPLSQEQLYLLMTDLSALELRLDVPLSADIMTEPLYPVIRTKIQKMASLSVEEYCWITYWLIAIKTPSFGVGLIGYKGIPNLHGEVEIGYGISPNMQGKGYMTEAVNAFSHWAFQADDCLAIRAQTDPHNIASQKVLQKAKFSLTGKKEDLLQWHLSKDHHLVQQ